MSPDEYIKYWPYRGHYKPVEDCAYEDCEYFIEKLNELFSGKLNGMKFAMPTEAQWEYAARGGKYSRGYKYSGSNNIDEVAWYDVSSSGTHPVARKQPNELGLYDMSGNVGEWCSDWYGRYSSNSQTNPKGPKRETHHVQRGGYYWSDKEDCRVSSREEGYLMSYRDYFGFRLVLVP